MTKQKQPNRWSKIKEGNFQYLNSMGGVKAQDFARIRSFGDKNSAITYDGLKVERQEWFFAEGYNMVRAVPYELHFVYEDKSGKPGRWSFMCTCGSLAGIISYKEVATLMSIENKGYILGCIAHTASKQNTGVGTHADGSHE